MRRPNAESFTAGSGMALLRDSFESVTHSFIIKIWLEEDDRAKWRGHITHVPGGERRYIEQLTHIAQFMAPYIKGMKPRRTGRFRNWLAARRKQLKNNGGHSG